MKRTGAFTILELLVSLAVLAVIIVLLATLFQSVSLAWLGAGAKSDRNRVGRVLLEFAARELRGAALPVETPSRPGNPNLQFLINPPLTNVPQEYRNPHCLFWQAPVATEQSWGEFAEVGYFVKWEPVAEGAIPSLRRFFINPSRYNESTHSYESNPDFLIYKNYTAWLAPALIEKVAPADAASGYAGLVAENVIGLWIRFYGADGREILESATSAKPATQFDSRVGYLYQPLGPGGVTTGVETRYLPARVSLSIAQLQSRYASQMGPTWRTLRTLANAPESLDAAVFQRRFEEAAKADAKLRELLPGLRIYEVSTLLDNAR